MSKHQHSFKSPLQRYLDIHEMSQVDFAHLFGRDPSVVSKLCASPLRARPAWLTIEEIHHLTRGEVSPADWFPHLIGPGIEAAEADVARAFDDDDVFEDDISA